MSSVPHARHSSDEIQGPLQRSKVTTSKGIFSYNIWVKSEEKRNFEKSCCFSRPAPEHMQMKGQEPRLPIMPPTAAFGQAEGICASVGQVVLRDTSFNKAPPAAFPFLKLPGARAALMKCERTRGTCDMYCCDALSSNMSPRLRPSLKLGESQTTGVKTDQVTFIYKNAAFTL